jgi:hypothetical protein
LLLENDEGIGKSEVLEKKKMEMIRILEVR